MDKISIALQVVQVILQVVEHRGGHHYYFASVHACDAVDRVVAITVQIEYVHYVALSVPVRVGQREDVDLHLHLDDLVQVRNGVRT